MLNRLATNPRSQVYGRDGLLKDVPEGYVLQDGESFHWPMLMMDRETQTTVRVSDAQQARLDMMRQMSTAWAPPGSNMPPSRPAGPSPLQWRPPVGDGAEANRRVAQAFRDQQEAHAAMVQRMASGWRANGGEAS